MVIDVFFSRSQISAWRIRGCIREMVSLSVVKPSQTHSASIPHRRNEQRALSVRIIYLLLLGSPLCFPRPSSQRRCSFHESSTRRSSNCGFRCFSDIHRAFSLFLSLSSFCDLSIYFCGDSRSICTIANYIGVHASKNATCNFSNISSHLYAGRYWPKLSFRESCGGNYLLRVRISSLLLALPLMRRAGNFLIAQNVTNVRCIRRRGELFKWVIFIRETRNAKKYIA